MLLSSGRSKTGAYSQVNMAAAFSNLRQMVSGAQSLAPPISLNSGSQPDAPAATRSGLHPVFYSQSATRSICDLQADVYTGVDAPRLAIHPALWTTRAIDVRAASTLRPARKKSISEHLRAKKLEREMLTLPADGEGTLGDLLAVPNSGTARIRF